MICTRKVTDLLARKTKVHGGHGKSTEAASLHFVFLRDMAMAAGRTFKNWEARRQSLTKSAIERF